MEVIKCLSVHNGVNARYKQTEVGVIPEDWVIKKLNDVVTFTNGKAHEQFIDEGGEYIVVNSKFISTEGKVIKKSSICICPLKKGDITMVMSDIPNGKALSKCFIIPSDNKYTLNQRICSLTTIGTDNRFLALVLNRHKYYLAFDSGTGQTNLKKSEVLDCPIQLPPTKAEQTAIATALSDADALIQSLEKLIAKKRNIKQGAMQELLKPKERWVVKKLGEIGTFSKGQGIRKDECMSGAIPCIRYGELYTRHNDYVKQYYSFISDNIAHTAKKLKQGDILFAGSGETKEEIGKCAAFIDNIVAYAGGDVVILSPVNVDPLFLGFYLNTPRVVKQKASRGQGDAVVHISAGNLKDIEISIPPLDEQTHIATVLSDMDAEISALETKLTKYKQMKQGMMQELLAGKTRLV